MKNMKRPTTHDGSIATTPHATEMIRLLGGVTSGSVALATDEFRSINKLYGFKPEKPNAKPPAPEPVPDLPPGSDYTARLQHEEDLRKHKAACKALESWTDPRPFHQAGADRNALRHAAADGLRLLAWLAKFVQPGEDPLKVLVRFAADAGCDVEPNDVDWADSEDAESEDA
jgi:hypothetical protein